MEMSGLLSLFRPMKFSVKFKLGWSIVYIKGTQVKMYKNIVFLSQKMIFVLANSADTD